MIDRFKNIGRAMLIVGAVGPTALALVILNFSQAHGCLICLPVPKKTAADYVLESECVVLAREHPEKPFTYQAVKVLKGDPGSRDIDLFVNSTSRSQLNSQPDARALLVRANSKSPWRSLGVIDDPYRQVLDRLLAAASQWDGPQGAARRCQFFVSLLGHRNRDLSELGYLETARAPYSVIKRIAPHIPQEDLEPFFSRREYFEWRPLAILLLAQNPHENQRKRIRESYELSSKYSLTSNLAAWTTALIEIDGARAIEQIERDYFRNTNRSDDEMAAVILALSVHGRNGHTSLRDQITRCYGLALENYPRSVGRITQDLADWKRWAYQEQAFHLLMRKDLKLEPDAKKAIQEYVGKTSSR